MLDWESGIEKYPIIFFWSFVSSTFTFIWVVDYLLPITILCNMLFRSNNLLKELLKWFYKYTPTYISRVSLFKCIFSSQSQDRTKQPKKSKCGKWYLNQSAVVQFITLLLGGGLNLIFNWSVQGVYILITLII